MPKCPACEKEVYHAERVSAMGQDYHPGCLKCDICAKTLTAGKHAHHNGKPYCNHPCYKEAFGPKGYGYGRTESQIIMICICGALVIGHHSQPRYDPAHIRKRNSKWRSYHFSANAT